MLTAGSVCVAGSAGGRELCGIGSTSSGGSILPLLRKTLACGFATMTRGGSTPSAPEVEAVGTVGGALGTIRTVTAAAAAAATPGFGTTLVAGRTVSTLLGLAGKRGVVFALGGAPVAGGALGLAGGCVGLGGNWGIAPEGGRIEPEGGREMLGIGFVTAVDQAGGMAGTGVGSDERLSTFNGSVVAAEMLGRGVILVEAGFKGLGGRLMRRVSRLGALASGVAESAILIVFIVISGNVQWRNS